jgi:predicted Zn-dependent protease
MRGTKIFCRLMPVAVASVALAGAAPAAQQQQDPETTLGDESFKELHAKAEIIRATPLYGSLQPITEPIAKVAGQHYNHPFKFYLVHEAQPNAFSVPGGNVFVVDSLLYFARSKEEMAGVLCHEVSHTLHHDSMKKIEQDRKVAAAELGALILLHPTVGKMIAVDLLGSLHKNGYSRELESAADITGSDVCAAAGYNPYGLIWLFQDFKNANADQVPQLLSDHPSFAARIEALQRHFKENPKVFGKFNSDPKSATPLGAQKDAPVIFLR